MPEVVALSANILIPIKNTETAYRVILIKFSIFINLLLIKIQVIYSKSQNYSNPIRGKGIPKSVAPSRRAKRHTSDLPSALCHVADGILVHAKYLSELLGGMRFFVALNQQLPCFIVQYFARFSYLPALYCTTFCCNCQE